MQTLSLNKQILIATLLLASTMGAHAADPLYRIYLNPFLVQKYEQKAVDAGYVRPDAWGIKDEDERFAYVMNKINEFKYSPGIEQARNELINDFKITSYDKELQTIPVLYANLTDAQVKSLRNSDRVVSVDEIKEGKNFIFSTYYDYITNNETVPWAKREVNADDSLTSTMRFYIVDSYLYAPLLTNPWPGAPASTSEFNLVSTDSGSNPGDHAPTVLSVATARSNAERIRGINPGQPIVHLGLGLYSNSGDIEQKINLITSMSEWVNQFSTLNLSLNAEYSSDNSFWQDADVGRAIRRASSRFLVVQSAGNQDDNACGHAFSPADGQAHADDGIMVIGGTDRYGARFPSSSNPAPYNASSAMRSNYGKCIDAWAPGHQMTTTRPDGSLVSLSGTSYSAPIVAALAGRYGTTTTRPIERETYIRESLYSTGQYEYGYNSNELIKIAKYTDPVYHSIPKRLPVSGVYSMTNVVNRNFVVDQKFFNDFWNAGSNSGSIVLDLGYSRNVRGLRVMIRSSAQMGRFDFFVYGSDSITNYKADSSTRCNTV